MLFDPSSSSESEQENEPLFMHCHDFTRSSSLTQLFDDPCSEAAGIWKSPVGIGRREGVVVNCAASNIVVAVTVTKTEVGLENINRGDKKRVEEGVQK